MYICRYKEEDAQRWDAFVKDSKNGTFLFLRGYMDYHSYRFKDHSLLFFDEKSHLIAILPGNETILNNTTIPNKIVTETKEYYSHQGLTYGGFILSTKNRTEDVLSLFEETLSYLKANGFSKWHYKPVPTIYHLCPAQEDEYALWKNKAKTESCLISATVLLDDFKTKPRVEGCRNRGKNKALENGYQIIESQQIEVFWPIMVENLRQKYAASPVHSLEEMQLLQNRFPKNIRCFLAVRNGTPQAGAIVYLANKNTVHLQYAHATETGKKERVLDLLYISMIETFKESGFMYFDFGTSNEDQGRFLNTSLIANKEDFGARGIVYKTYCLEI